MRGSILANQLSRKSCLARELVATAGFRVLARPTALWALEYAALTWEPSRSATAQLQIEPEQRPTTP